MESPVSTIKNNISLSKIMAFIVTAFVVFAIMDFAGLTNWVISPVSSFKAWMANRDAMKNA